MGENKNPMTPKPNVVPAGGQFHEHEYTYAGIVYTIATYATAGTGARDVLYYNWFFCPGCLDNQYQRLGGISTTYEGIRFNATPAPLGAGLK